MGLLALAANEGAHKATPQSACSRISLLLCPLWDLLEVTEKKKIATPDQTVLTVTSANSMSIWHIDIFSGSNNNNNNMFCESCSWTIVFCPNNWLGRRRH